MNPLADVATGTGPISNVAWPDESPETLTTGAILFARYAYPPNELGYCGPADHRALLDYGAEGAVDRGLLQLAQGFAGAWPYLEFIAGATGIRAPLDRRVVEAYWLGGDLLDTIDMTRFGNELMDRFRKRAGAGWGYLAEAIPVGAVPNHAFHVFGIYPWVGLLQTGRADTPLEQLEKCRIRWGQVVSTEGDQVTVLSRPVTYDGTDIGLGERRLETVRRSIEGLGFLDAFRSGDWVSMHWGWVCDRLSRRQLHLLQRSTLRQFEITNRRVAHSGPRNAIG
ncbi:MAG: DUF6390 family protein [Candidatus Limnocylindrales bacterium]